MKYLVKTFIVVLMLFCVSTIPIIYSDMYGPPMWYIIGILFYNVAFLASIGAVIGYVLSKKVRGKYMAIGSAVYWTISLINLYFFTVNVLFFWSTFLVPFLNLAYIIGKYRLNAIKVFIITFLSTFITLFVTFTKFTYGLIYEWDSFYYITSLLYSLVVAVFSVLVYELYKLVKKRYGKMRQT